MGCGVTLIPPAKALYLLGRPVEVAPLHARAAPEDGAGLLGFSGWWAATVLGGTFEVRRPRPDRAGGRTGHGGNSR